MLLGRQTSHNCRSASSWNTCLLFPGVSRLCLEEEAAVGINTSNWEYEGDFMGLVVIQLTAAVVVLLFLCQLSDILLPGCLSNVCQAFA